MAWRMLKELQKGRLFGHPIHAMLVHFPAALFPIAFVFDCIGWAAHDLSFTTAALYTLSAGVMSGFLAAIFGAIDYAKLSPKLKAWKIASWHAALNVTWLMLFTVLVGVKLQHYPSISLPSLCEMLTEMVGVIGIIISGYLGGELVFGYHIGSKMRDYSDEANKKKREPHKH